MGFERITVGIIVRMSTREIIIIVERFKGRIDPEGVEYESRGPAIIPAAEVVDLEGRRSVVSSSSEVARGWCLFFGILDQRRYLVWWRNSKKA